MYAGGGTNSNPVQSILVCFMYKDCNPIQNALKLLIGTIFVTRWITEKNSESLFLRKGQENDNSDLGIHLIRNSGFPENTKLLLSPGPGG